MNMTVARTQRSAAVAGRPGIMADQNNTDDKGKFYSEILSPSELFAARSRSHKIPVRGQKDFFPDDSDEQKQRLEQSLNEHWSLLSEERVERLGNLVKGEWIPSEQIVELQSPAGKFWQTMGFSANGKQCLLPEEALYLMECGNLQVFYQDLPLSIQDGYEKFLSANTVSLQQYQVFGHLKRLGYVVLRFDPSSESSSYARQLNLPQSRDRAGRTLKRKRSLSPAPSSTPTATCSRAEAQEECSTEKMEEDKCNEGEEDKKLPEPPEAQSSADEGGGRSWWMTDVLGDSDKDSGHGSKSVSSCWDFSSISFPDLGSTSREHFPGGLAPPDPSLLPGDLKVGFCDVGAWRQKINLRQVKMSANEQKKEKYRRRWDVNKNREVRRCRNWAEYQELMARRKGKREGRPAHLWNREVTPLHDPTQPIATGELLEKISVIKPTHLLEGASSPTKLMGTQVRECDNWRKRRRRILELMPEVHLRKISDKTSRLKDADDWRICFNVYQPDTVADFKKSNPGKPYSRMCVCSFHDPVPDLRAIKLLAYQSGDIPVVIAVVDYGDISFYTFKDFQLPTDVYP